MAETHDRKNQDGNSVLSFTPNLLSKTRHDGKVASGHRASLPEAVLSVRTDHHCKETGTGGCDETQSGSQRSEPESQLKSRTLDELDGPVEGYDEKDDRELEVNLSRQDTNANIDTNMKIPYNKADLQKDDDVDMEANITSRLRTWFRESEGKSAWLLLIRVILFNILTGINFSAFGLLYVEYSVHFEASKAVLGLIVSLQTSIIALGGIFLSWPMERFGIPRVAFVGAVVGAIGLTLASFSTSVTLLYVTQGALTGVGFCISSLPSPVVVQLYFSQNRALAGGLAILGFSIGNILGPIIIEQLLAQYGWRGCLLILGALMANRAPLGLSLWEPHNYTHHKHPMKKPSTDTIQNKPQRRKCLDSVKKLLNVDHLRNPAYVLFCLGTVFQRFFVNGYVFHTASRAIYLGINLEGAAFISSLIFTSNTAMRLIVSFVSNLQCVNRIVQYAVGILVGVVSVVLTVAVGGYNGAVVGAIVCGIHLALTHTIVAVVLVDLMGVENITDSLAIFNFMIGIMTLFATPFCGWLYDITGNYDIPFLVMAGSAVMGAILVGAVNFIKKPDNNKLQDEIEVERPLTNAVSRASKRLRYTSSSSLDI